MNVRRVLLAAMVCATMVAMSQSIAFAQGTTFFAVLLGGNEVSNAGVPDFGDQNGFGSATVIIPDATTVCFALVVTGIVRPTVAHIHENTAGQNGPIRVDFMPNIPPTGNPGTASGCVRNLPEALVLRIRTNPSRFYVNVHNDQFPGGALRGQLF